jgi:hypothetical protein
LDRQLAAARAVQLYREHRLPSAQDQLPILDEEGGEARQQELPAVGVTVDRLIERDLDSPGEIVVLVARALGRNILEQIREVAKESRFVLVDRETDSRVQRLHVHPADPQTGAPHFASELLCNVDELRCTRALEMQPLGDHH